MCLTKGPQYNRLEWILSTHHLCQTGAPGDWSSCLGRCQIANVIALTGVGNVQMSRRHELAAGPRAPTNVRSANLEVSKNPFHRRRTSGQGAPMRQGRQEGGMAFHMHKCTACCIECINKLKFTGYVSPARCLADNVVPCNSLLRLLVYVCFQKIVLASC